MRFWVIDIDHQHLPILKQPLFDDPFRLERDIAVAPITLNVTK